MIENEWEIIRQQGLSISIQYDRDDPSDIILDVEIKGDDANVEKIIQAIWLKRKYARFLIAMRRFTDWTDSLIPFGRKKDTTYNELLDAAFNSCLFSSGSKLRDGLVKTAQEVLAVADIPSGYPKSQLWFAESILAVIEEAKTLNEKLLREHPPLESPEGYVYLLRSLTPDCQWKIGRTHNPADRVATFRVAFPFKVEYEHIIPTRNAKEAEARLHKQYKHARTEGEWFDLSPIEVAEIRAITWL